MIHRIKPQLLLLLFACAGLLTVTASAQKPSAPLLLVANQDDRSLSIINSTTEKQIVAVPVGGVTGHEIAASPDGRTAYVPITVTPV
jgi:YVTN family beta-propeller protein